MHIRFTKMQGAGNDFVVLDETRERLNLGPAHYRYLADRHFGVGADQILTVRPALQADVDFECAFCTRARLNEQNLDSCQSARWCD